MRNNYIRLTNIFEFFVGFYDKNENSILFLSFQATNIGKEMLCENCVADPGTASPTRQQQQQVQLQQNQQPTKDGAVSPTPVATAHQQMENLKEDYDSNECAGCGEMLKEGQALVALDRQ